MSEIRAIETRYKGYRFRSRLEARWAVFFDAIGIEWEYEPQGYYVGGRAYLPDFYLRSLGVFVEIKPPSPPDFEGVCRLMEAFRNGVGPIVLFMGDPGEWWAGRLFCSDIGDSSAGCSEWEVKIGADAALHVYGTGTKVLCNECDGWKELPRYVWDSGFAALVGQPVLEDAVSAARSARFEHGEAPR